MQKERLKRYSFNVLMALAIFLGLYLRFKGYWMNQSFWHDECGIAWNIKFKSYSQLFGVLDFLQVAPPFFLIITKFFVNIFGYSERVFRFIPFLAGCLSIVGFYFLSCKALKQKMSILLAVFLFSINQMLINYSFEFKPYEVDVFFTIICLLFFVNLDIEKLNRKKTFLYGFLLSIVPWFSFISVFAIVGGFLDLFFNRKKNDIDKKLILALPLLISGLLFLKFFVFANYTGTGMVSGWGEYFVTLNPLQFLSLLVKNIKYLFMPVKYILFFLVLFVWGIVIYAKEKSKYFSVSILTFIAFLIASLLHIYPFGERIVLFLTPLFLLFVLKPLDLIALENKLKSIVIIILLVATFYTPIKSANALIKLHDLSRGEYAREMMRYLVPKLKKGDIIFVNQRSKTDFTYYSSFYDIKNKVVQEEITGVEGKDYIKYLNSLKKGSYWFYIPYNSHATSVVGYILAWAQTKNVEYFWQNGRSILMYVKVKKGKE